MSEKYKPVPGRQEGQVEVLVRQSVLDRWGEPTVDFEGLTEMVKAAGLPEDTRIKLFSGRWVGGTGELKKLARGGHVPLTKTIYSGVGLNGTVGMVHPSEIPQAAQDELIGAPTAAMRKLVHNALRASGVRGETLRERERELYAQHAADIQFEAASPDAL